jgi:general secretion pathway protein D
VVVLGGLIEDNSVKGENRVPYLGNIPIIGLLFKTRNATSTKNNLIMFIRPKILRDQSQAAYETDLKYNYMIDQEKKINSQKEMLPLLPGVSRGQLEAVPPPPPPGTNPAPNSKRAPPPSAVGGNTPPSPAPPSPSASPATPPPSGDQTPLPAPPAGTAVPPGTPATEPTATPAPPPQGTP